ncbi:MAG: uridine kinase [Candidatus Aureabacteria bacterium]|nr:uridine kinase [Candidatus Auribacterota bacterium]
MVDDEGKNMPLFIGIAGGTSSGKTTLSHALKRELGDFSIQIICQDNYYYCRRNMYPEERSKINYDHPSAIDFAFLKEHISLLRKGESIQGPLYDFKTHTRKTSSYWIKPSALIIIEGTLILWDEEIRNQFHYKTFLDIPEDIRLLRRIDRDIQERARTYPEVKKQYLDTVRPMHIKYVEPCKTYADIIIEHEVYLLQVNEMIKSIKNKLSGVSV